MPPNFRRSALCAFLLTACSCQAQSVFINELHYDNAGGDVGEGVEIAGPAGTNLAGYSIVLYNGNGGALYSTINLSGMIPNKQGGYGMLWFPIASIENGNADALALVQGSTIIQFLGYEGSFTAVGGVASGMTSTDIGRAENSSTPVGHSLQLSGSGTLYTNFNWQAPAAATPGELNTGQSFGGGPVYSTTLTISPSTFLETAGSNAATATLTLSPAPASAVTISLTNPDTTELTVPASVVVPISGTANFSVGALTDGLVDGDQSVTITASPAGNSYPTQQATVTVQDTDVPVLTPRPVLRVAAINVHNGVGAPNSTEFNAVKSILQRINADVMAFEELSAATSFADLKSLAASMGIPTNSAHVAYEKVNPSLGPYKCGDDPFSSSSQCIAIISRFPISGTTQIGRGATDGRQEITRYPLYVEIDVPGVPAASDPAFVAVHLKASDTYADRFRRALESYRITQFLQGIGRTGLTGNVFVLGDFNEQDYIFDPPNFSTNIIPSTHVFTDASTLPASFVLGSDITGANAITIPYGGFPHPSMALANLSTNDAKQADPSATRTFNASGDARLDYIYFSKPKVDAGVTRLEVYNSRIENAFDGMSKTGALPTPSTSETASDHYAIFGDFALLDLPKITVSLDADYVFEKSPVPVSATVTLSQGSASGLAVNLSAREDGRISPLPSLTFNPGQTQQVIPISILRPTSVGTHRSLAVHATATDYFPGQDSLEIRNHEAAGGLLISQYVDPLNASGPKAIEIFNRDFPLLDFAQQNLIIRRYSNGSELPEKEATINTGLLEQGQTLVVGGDATRDYLIGAGLIQTSTTQAFTNTAGKLRFWLDSFTYNGDDALELLLDYTRQDVLGVIGQDPGTAWTGNGVSTANQNIELKTTIATGSEGLADPSCRFTTISTNDSQTGFGIPPALTDPYLSWATGFSLGSDVATPLSDADADGWDNMLEYALLTSPSSGQVPVLISGVEKIGQTTYGTLQFTHRTDDPSLVFQVQSSMDLQSWSNNGSLVASILNGNGTRTDTYSAATPANGHRLFLRLQVTRD